jgi:chromatin remodeling complex protein RSC6
MNTLYEYQLNATQSIIVKNCYNAQAHNNSRSHKANSCDKVHIENVDGKFVITIQEQKEKVKVKKEKNDKRAKLFHMSTQLCEFFEVPYDIHMSRKEIVKKINQYIFKNKLKNKEHKNQFIVDDKLKVLFGLTDDLKETSTHLEDLPSSACSRESSIKIYHVSKYLKNHVLSEYKEEKKEVSEKCPFKECPSFKEAFEQCPSFKEAFEKCPKMKDIKNCPFTKMNKDCHFTKMNKDCPFTKMNKDCPFMNDSEEEYEYKEKTPSKIADPEPISDELCDFLNVEHGTQMSRIDVIKEVNRYIQTHNLRNLEDKRNILLDEKLQKLLSPPEGESVKFFNLFTYLKKHFP